MSETRQMPERLQQMGRIDAVCRRFERSWKEGVVPSIEEEVSAAAAVDRADLLAELLPLEWAYRRLRGEAFVREEYRERFSAFAEIVDRLWHRWLEDNDHAAEATGRTGEQVAVVGRLREQPDDIHLPTSAGPSSYQQLEPLGQGGMGVVYRAYDPRLRRQVALKRLHTVSANKLARLQREAEALAQLQHPHIVTIHGWEELSGQPVLVLEYVIGGSLEERLRDRPLSVEDSARLVSILARAVQAAHDVGIVHRDLKPANVLVAPPVQGSSGTVAGFFPKVSDFGLARIESTGLISDGGAVMGTADYMAPEQVEGRSAEVGPGTDVWALGVILYRCLTGSLPFTGGSVLETLERVKSCEYSAPRELSPELPAELAEICRRCLDKDFSRRPSAGEMANLLDRWLVSCSASFSGRREIRRQLKADLRTQSFSPGRSRRLLAVFCLLIALAGVAAGCWLFWLRPNDGEGLSGEEPAGASGAAVEPLRIIDFRAQHLHPTEEKDDDGAKQVTVKIVGEIGKQSFELPFGDMVRVDAKLSRPAYLYLVAFNADGKEQLLWPASAENPMGGDPRAKPREVEYLHYPPPHPKTGHPRGVTLNDEKAGGMQAIALLASSSPLPKYLEYQAPRGWVAWNKQFAQKGVWLTDTQGVYRAWEGLGVVRGEPVKTPEAQPLLAFARQLKTGDIELVEVLAFPVGARPPEDEN